MDDGQVVLPAPFADQYLRAFDAALSAIGATRATGGEAKSVALHPRRALPSTRAGVRSTRGRPARRHRTRSR
eukprot:10316968-Alexandrium_andersonii.AAC.1